MKIARPKSQPEILYERMVQVIETYGGKAPAVDAPGSLSLVAEFCWALDVVPKVVLYPNEKQNHDSTD